MDGGWVTRRQRFIAEIERVIGLHGATAEKPRQSQVMCLSMIGVGGNHLPG